MKSSDFPNILPAAALRPTGFSFGRILKPTAVLFGLTAALLLPTLAQAVQEISCNTSGLVFNTAYNTDSSYLPAGQRDRNWQAVAGRTEGDFSGLDWQPAFVVTPREPWAPPFPSANWISVNKDAANQGRNPYYRYDMNLADSVDPNSFSLKLDFYADDRLMAVYVNGVKQTVNGIPQPGNSAFQESERAVATISTGWRAGFNTLVLEGRDLGTAVGLMAQARTSVTCAKPAVTVSALSQGGTGTFSYSGTNGFAPTDVVTTAPGTAVAGAPRSLANFSTATTITQAPSKEGFTLTGISCTGLGTGGTATPTINGIAGGSVTLDAKAVSNDRNIACTFTNVAAPKVSTAFLPSTLSSGANTTLSFTLTNPPSSAAGTVSFTDLLPASLVLAANPAIGGTCTNAATAGVVTAAGGGNQIVVSGLATPAASSCTLTVAVTNLGGATNASCAANPAAFSNGPGNFSALTGVVAGPDTACLVVTPPSPGNSGVRISTDRQAADGSAQDVIEVLLRDAAGAGVGGQRVSFAATPGVDLGAGVGQPLACVTAATGLCSIRPTSSVANAYGTAVSIASGVLSGTFTAAGQNYLPSPARYSFLTQAGSLQMAFAPAVVVPGGSSTLTIILTNPSATQTIDGLAFADTYPPGMLNSATPGATTTCTGGSVSTPTNATLLLGGATLAAGASCTVTVQVSAAALGSYMNTLPAGSVTANNAASNPAAVSAVLSVRAPALVRLQKITLGGTGSHFQFSQSNLVATPPSIDTLSANTPTPAAPVAIQVKISGSAVTLTELPANPFVLTGASCRDSNAGITGNPASFGNLAGNLLTIPAAQVLPGADILCQFTNTYRAGLGGRVFDDTGAGDGRANDGIRDGVEAGLAGVPVALGDCGSGRYGQTVTDASGAYTLAVPAAVPNGTSLCVETPHSATRQPTGASAGGTALSPGTPTDVGGTRYTFSRDTASERIAFTWAGQGGVSLDFGSVPHGSLVHDALGTGRPGSTVSYGHVFTAGTAGQLQFSVHSAATPESAEWSPRVFADPGCTGQRQPGAAQVYPPAAGSSVVAGQVVCVVLQESIPAQAAPGSRNDSTLQAAFALANTAPTLSATYRVDDVTTVSTNALELLKQVRNVSQGVTTFGASNLARPGETLEYRIGYTNTSPEAIHQLTLNDTTPAYTRFAEAHAGTTPAALSNCRKTTPASATPVDCASTQPAGGQGALEWRFSGSLPPGASGEVFFRVVLD